jgi:outer membrane protein TolC
VADRHSVESAKYALESQINNRSYELAGIWIDLERYKLLNEKIESRLAILNPLIEQLEKVADAGVGDASKVAAAQRTVSTIKVTQTDVTENLEIARVNFVNAFGGLPRNVPYDEPLIKNLLPGEISIKMSKEAPAILSDFSAYKASEANLSAIKAQDSYNVGFETRLTRPLGGSSYDSDESLGLVVRKTLNQQKKISAEIEKAEALIKSSMARLKSTLRDGERKIKNAQQTIKSMDNAIELARASAEVTSNEIAFLRRQLIIGQSTLDNVLSAEARFYDAETKEINFEADKRKAEMLILTSLGLISGAMNMSLLD